MTFDHKRGIVGWPSYIIKNIVFDFSYEKHFPFITHDLIVCCIHLADVHGLCRTFIAISILQIDSFT